MKILFLAAVALAFVTAEDSAARCKCWEGYEQRNGTDGPECAGVLLRNIMPCNVVRVPKCVCTGNVSRIMFDKSGGWCSLVTDGKEVKKWNCENKEDWKEYEQQLADSKVKQ